GTLDCPLGGTASTNQVELIPGWSARRRLDVLHFVSRDRGKDVPRICFPRGSRSDHLAARMHHSAIAHRGEHRRKGAVPTENLDVKPHCSKATAWRGRKR